MKRTRSIPVSCCWCVIPRLLPLLVWMFSGHDVVQSFVVLPLPTTCRSSSSLIARRNFFKDMLDTAFANDATLSKSDVKDGSIDSALYNTEEQQQQQQQQQYITSTAPTQTQRQWHEAQARMQSTQRGAPIREAQWLEDTKWTVDLYLSGVPSKDPSNDLYAAKTNISTRAKQQGMDLPPEASVQIQVQFLANNVCRVLSETPFTKASAGGEWKLSDDGTMVRFSFQVLGYSRTVQTKGTITNVFWSDRDQVNTSTSTSYTIPAGMVYGDVQVGYGSSPGTLQMPDRGVLRVEQTMGLLNAGSRMVPCGQFVGTQVGEERTTESDA